MGLQACGAERRIGATHVDMLELDVRLSADGHVMVIHDETVDRTTDGSGRLADMTVAEVAALDAGWRASSARSPS